MQSSHLGRGWGAGKPECIIGDSKIEKRGKPEQGQTSVFSPHGRANKLLPSSSRISYKFGTFKITNLRYSHRKQLNLSSVHKWSYSAGVSSLSTMPSRSYVTRNAQAAPSRGTQRRFPSKYIVSTIQATQITFRCSEMHSKRRFNICFCSVILGELQSFRNYKGFSIIFPKNLDAISSITKLRHSF